MPNKKWYEKKKYINFTPSTPREWGQRVWDKFEEELDKRGYDNSVGNYNYLMGMILMGIVMEMVSDINDTVVFKIVEEKINKKLNVWEKERQ